MSTENCTSSVSLWAKLSSALEGIDWLRSLDETTLTESQLGHIQCELEGISEAFQAWEDSDRNYLASQLPITGPIKLSDHVYFRNYTEAAAEIVGMATYFFADIENLDEVPDSCRGLDPFDCPLF